MKCIRMYLGTKTFKALVNVAMNFLTDLITFCLTHARAHTHTYIHTHARTHARAHTHTLLRLIFKHLMKFNVLLKWLLYNKTSTVINNVVIDMFINCMWLKNKRFAFHFTLFLLNWTTFLETKHIFQMFVYLQCLRADVEKFTDWWFCCFSIQHV